MQVILPFGDLAPAMFTFGCPPRVTRWLTSGGAPRTAPGVLGYARLDAWGDAEILMIVHSRHRGAGVGGFLLERLEREALAGGLDYVYNVVPVGPPRNAGIDARGRRHNRHRPATPLAVEQG